MIPRLAAGLLRICPNFRPWLACEAQPEPGHVAQRMAKRRTETSEDRVMADSKTHFDCHHCGAVEWSKVAAIYDRDKDCTVAYHCTICGHERARDLTEIIAVADPRSLMIDLRLVGDAVRYSDS